MEIGINQSTIMQCDTEEFISACAEAGFKAVELRIPKLKETLYRTSHRDIMNLLGKYAISVISLNSLEEFSFVPEENLDLLQAECEHNLRSCGERCLPLAS